MLSKQHCTCDENIRGLIVDSVYNVKKGTIISTACHLQSFA
jgi:hypothetical protein